MTKERLEEIIRENNEISLAEVCCRKGELREGEGDNYYYCSQCGSEIDVEGLNEEDLMQRISCTECLCEFDVDLDDIDTDLCEKCQEKEDEENEEDENENNEEEY